MINFIYEYWFICLGLIAGCSAAGFFIGSFSKLPTDEQIANVKEWLKYAVTVAEKELGSGTGQLKLRTVYDMFLSKFPQIAKVVEFAKFSEWVSDSLTWLETQLTSNEKLKEFVEKEGKS